MLLAGLPNTGKSSVLNALKRLAYSVSRKPETQTLHLKSGTALALSMRQRRGTRDSCELHSCMYMYLDI